MRNRELYDALRRFARDAATLLCADQRAGAEIPFDVEEDGADVKRPAGPRLYRYRPLTERFIRERWERLRALPSFRLAAAALTGGARLWLEAQGEGEADPEPALLAMLERLWEDRTDLSFPDERFERLYSDLENTLYGDARQFVVALAFEGVALAGNEPLALAPGLRLVRADRLDADPAVHDLPAWAQPSSLARDEETVGAVAVLERLVGDDTRAAEREALAALRDLRVALRLLGDGAACQHGLAARRIAGGRWTPLPTVGAGGAAGAPLAIDSERGAELAELLAVTAQRDCGPRLELALRRFDRALATADSGERLLDLLVALRALLGEHTDTDRATLALRVAALCAEPDRRQHVRGELERALSAERTLLAGAAPALADEPATHAAAAALEEHVRALLRDVLCGYLDIDLARIADDILLRASAGEEIRVRDARASESSAGDRDSGAGSEPARDAGCGDGDRAPSRGEPDEEGQLALVADRNTATVPLAAAGSAQPLGDRRTWFEASAAEGPFADADEWSAPV